MKETFLQKKSCEGSGFRENSGHSKKSSYFDKVNWVTYKKVKKKAKEEDVHQTTRMMFGKDNEKSLNYFLSINDTFCLFIIFKMTVGIE